MEDLYKEIAKGNIKDEISRMSLLYYLATEVDDTLRSSRNGSRQM